MSGKEFEPQVDADVALEEEYAQVDEVGKEIDLTEDGGVIKVIKQIGAGHDKPEKGDKVTVHYTGTLEDGTKFDSSRDRDDPFTFTLGEGQVIKGWDVSVATMKKGERSVVTLRSDYGYGAGGSPPKIPGDATLVFDIELLSWHSDRDLTGDGGVVRTTLAEGEGWANPGEDDELTIFVTATAVGASPDAAPLYKSPDDGEVVTLSSLASTAAGKDGPAQQVFACQALVLALKKMKKGERVGLRVQPRYGPPTGPLAGQALELEITLSSWNKVERLEGGVVKKTVVAVEEWQTPNDGATVTLAYVGRVAGTGEVFARVSAEAPLVVRTDADELPEGLEAAVMKMKKGEKCLVSVPAAMAFGDAGAAAEQGLAPVPPGADVEYEVSLLDMKNAKGTWELSTPEKLAAANEKKNHGNAYFKAGRWQRAVRQWKQAEELVRYDDSWGGADKVGAREIKRSVNLNLAAAYLKQQAYADARAAAAVVLEMDGTCLKALYRRAQALMGTQDFVEAEQDIKTGLGLDPENADFKLLYRKWKAAAAALGKQEAKVYGRMFGPRPVAKPEAAVPVNAAPTPEETATSETNVEEKEAV